MKTRTPQHSRWTVEATASLEGGGVVRVTITSKRSADDAVTRAEKWATAAVDTGIDLTQVLSVHLDPVQSGTGKTFVRARPKTAKVAVQ